MNNKDNEITIGILTMEDGTYELGLVYPGDLKFQTEVKFKTKNEAYLAGKDLVNMLEQIQGITVRSVN